MEFTRFPVITYSHCLRFHIENHSPTDDGIYFNIFLGTLYDIIIRNIDCYVAVTTFILLLPVRKDFSIIHEINAFMLVLFISSIARNAIEIFSPQDLNTAIGKVDGALFYLQTIVFLCSIFISVIYPVVIKRQFIVPLPAVPDRLEVVGTAINEERGFKVFYEWLTENQNQDLKYLE